MTPEFFDSVSGIYYELDGVLNEGDSVTCTIDPINLDDLLIFASGTENFFDLLLNPVDVVVVQGSVVPGSSSRITTVTATADDTFIFVYPFFQGDEDTAGATLQCDIVVSTPD